MAKKRLTLPKDFSEIMERNNPDELEKVFESCNIDAYERDWMKTPALCMYGISEDFIKWMAAHGANINVSDIYGKTPLMKQAQLNQQERVKLLLQLGANIHAKDDSQQTALHYAKAPETIKILLENGSDPCAIDNMGNTPLMLQLLECRSHDTPRMAEAARLLLDAGDKVNDKMRKRVRNIGHEFENSRDGWAPDILQECEKGMQKLYTLFSIEPVPVIKKHSGNEPITVHATNWKDGFEELWDYLVPSSGHALTIQGEVIRICGKVTREILDNGSCNWSREYKKLPQALPDYFSMGNPIPASAFSSSSQTHQQQDENKELATLAKNIHADSTEEELYRLTELTVKWVMANPQPIKLEKVNYKR